MIGLQPRKILTDLAIFIASGRNNPENPVDSPVDPILQRKWKFKANFLKMYLKYIFMLCFRARNTRGAYA
ncbi:MAG: hypothetical protein CMQ38_02860 [Gammaproteobacteria bacterium]|nr:hypothetical protein [Gammaproteobacteria bacterium]|tara:strand:+ start:933 stop:1142 length:210 start_codon:yes stop_codon:yes gene_type:complete